MQSFAVSKKMFCNISQFFPYMVAFFQITRPKRIPFINGEQGHDGGKAAPPSP
jgi:hypothetical protein